MDYRNKNCKQKGGALLRKLQATRGVAAARRIPAPAALTAPVAPAAPIAALQIAHPPSAPLINPYVNTRPAALQGLSALQSLSALTGPALTVPAPATPPNVSAPISNEMTLPTVDTDMIANEHFPNRLSFLKSKFNKENILRYRGLIQSKSEIITKHFAQTVFAPQKIGQHLGNTRSGTQGAIERGIKLLIFELFTGICIDRPPPIIRYILRKGHEKVQENFGDNLAKEYPSIARGLSKIREFDYFFKRLGILSWNQRPRSISDFVYGVGMYTKRPEQENFSFSFYETIVSTVLIMIIMTIRNKCLEKAVGTTYEENLEKFRKILFLGKLLDNTNLDELFDTDIQKQLNPDEIDDLTELLKELLKNEQFKEDVIEFINTQVKKTSVNSPGAGEPDDSNEFAVPLAFIRELLLLMSRDQMGGSIKFRSKKNRVKRTNKIKQKGGSTRLLSTTMRSISRLPTGLGLSIRPRPSVLRSIAPLRVTSTLPQKYGAKVSEYSLKPSKYFSTTHNIGVESLQNIKNPFSLKKSDVLTVSFKKPKYNKFINSVFENSVAFDNFFKKSGVLILKGKPKTVTDFTIQTDKDSKGDNFKFSYFETVVKAIIIILVLVIRNKLMEGLMEKPYEKLLNKLEKSPNLKNLQTKNYIELERILQDKEFVKNFKLLLKDKQFRDDFIEFLNKFQNIEERDKLNPNQQKILKHLIILLEEEFKIKGNNLDEGVGVVRCGKMRSKKKNGKSQKKTRKRKKKKKKNKKN